MMSKIIQRLPFLIKWSCKNQIWQVYYREICLEEFINKEDAIYFAETNSIKNCYGK